MSAHVVLSCDRQFRLGTCPAQVRVFGAVDEETARRAAGEAGWHRSAAGDQCPRCAGRAHAWPPLIVVKPTREGPDR